MGILLVFWGWEGGVWGVKFGLWLRDNFFLNFVKEMGGFRRWVYLFIVFFWFLFIIVFLLVILVWYDLCFVFNGDLGGRLFVFDEDGL